MTLEEQCQQQRAVIERRRGDKAMADDYQRVMRVLNTLTERAKGLSEAAGEGDTSQHRRFQCWRHIRLHVAHFYRGRRYDADYVAGMTGSRIGYGELYSVLLGEVHARHRRRKTLELQLRPNDAAAQAQIDAVDRLIQRLSHALKALELAHEGWWVGHDFDGKKRLNYGQAFDGGEAKHPKHLDKQGRDFK